MSYMDTGQTRLTFNTVDSNIPTDHITHFIKKFISKNFSYLDKKYEKTRGRPAFPKTILLNVILYGTYDNFKNTQEISELCECNIYYRYLTRGLIPSQRTIQRFMQEHDHVFIEVLNKLSQYITEKYNLENVQIDGVLMSDDENDLKQLENINEFTEELIQLMRKYERKNDTFKKEYALSHDAIEVYENKKLTISEKINSIEEIQKTLKKSNEKSIFINMIDALINLNKTRIYPITYNNTKRKDLNGKIISSINIDDESNVPKKISTTKLQEILLLIIAYNMNIMEKNKLNQVDYNDFEKFMIKLRNKYPNIKFTVNPVKI
ncbi:transposase [Methanosphaera sp.]